VTVSEDHLSTIQVTTSKPDVYIKLSVYDEGEEVVSVTGKGVAQIPAVIFHKDRLEGAEALTGRRDSRPSSKIQTKQIGAKTEEKKMSKVG
jgi:hypothetical protein